MKVLCNSLPPTDNNAYSNSSRGRHLADSAKHWKQHVHTMFLAQTTRKEREALRNALYQVHIVFELALYTKAGKIRRWDVSSHQKLTVDAIADSIDSDDRNCVYLTIAKTNRPDGHRDTTTIHVWKT